MFLEDREKKRVKYIQIMIMSMEDKNLLFGKSTSWCPNNLLLFFVSCCSQPWRDIRDFALLYMRDVILSPISFKKTEQADALVLPLSFLSFIIYLHQYFPLILHSTRLGLKLNFSLGSLQFRIPVFASKGCLALKVVYH